MLPPAVADYLLNNRSRHLAELMDLLRFPSIANVSGPGEACAPCAQWLARRLEAAGCTARVVPTTGKPNVLAHAPAAAGPDAPRVLIYGHYDVQPADPLDQWTSPPFEPAVRDGAVYARGANDNKGQLFTHLMAIEAWQRTLGLPVNVTLLLEGEEEVGSPDLEPFIHEHKDELAADAAVISDSSFFADGVPSITYALRGLVYAELTLTGPNRDIHSGEYGGAATNPINALTAMIASLHDADGRVTLKGFYDDVLPLTDAERRAWDALPYNEATMARFLGAPDGRLGGGEKNLPALHRLWARPTLDCNGIVGGYTTKGSKTIIPAKASAKFSMRLVANQNPQKIEQALSEFVSANTPAGLAGELVFHASSRPVMLATQGPAMTAAQAAMSEAFGKSPVLIRCGASVPVTELIQRLLGLDAVLMGFGLPEDNLHSPNEHFKLDQFYRGSIASAAMLGTLAGL
ncbi:MAG: dipeptidase [Planctomycetaceae bacterium]|nr:dipeptidase [Planctomycetaceae bacterium]